MSWCCKKTTLESEDILTPAADVQRSIAFATGLLVVGTCALIAAGTVAIPRKRPVAMGEAGQLEVYAQLSDGPTRLWPDRIRRLPRPQQLAFRFSVNGTGPRLVRIDVETEHERFTAYEDIHYGPADKASLDYVLRFDETTPDAVNIWTSIESPHTMSISSRFPLQLVGGSRRFWEP